MLWRERHVAGWLGALWVGLAGSVQAATIADSVAEWSASGQQGASGWFYGYFNYTADADKVYQTANFTQFSAAQWDGTMYDLNAAAAGPWTELGRESTHPNGTNSAPGQEHWTIRRWQSDHAGQANLQWQLRKTNGGCGNGVVGILFVNGVEKDRATVDFGDTTGVDRSVVLTLAVGDRVDLAVTPNGADGCDGSEFSLRISDEIPDSDGDGTPDPADNCPQVTNPNQADGDSDGRGDVCDNCPADPNPTQSDRDGNGLGDACDESVLADSFSDWSATGTQGEKGWSNGYYNFTTDADKSYAVGDFIAFVKAQHWTGTQWALNLAGGAAPWTLIGPEDTHPNGTNSAPNQEHWTIRRWTSTYAGAAAITWHMRKSNPNGGGVGGSLFINGAEVDSAVIGGTDTAGVTRTAVASLSLGTRVDLALTPNGDDGADGSINWMVVSSDLPQLPDRDGDGDPDPLDNCPNTPNADQLDGDADGVGTACDNCPAVANPTQDDLNEDGVGDHCQDSDGDGRADALDNCPLLANANQADADADAVGTACDNCPSISNRAQTDSDADGLGDACDADSPGSRSGPWPLRISEIHFNPSEGDGSEFIELFNDGAQPLNLSLWRFGAGIGFEIPPGTIIAARGFLVLCRDPLVLSGRFGLPMASLIAWQGSNLDDNGENLVLVDPLGVEVEQVRFDDELPWPIEADGQGASLQRVCLSARADHPTSWAAGAPSPLAANAVQQCPPAPLPVPRVAINEIHYHPLDDADATLEYIELANNTAAPIDLSGWSFSQGVEFSFPAGSAIAASGYLVVCRDQTALRARFGISNTVGNYLGQLSDDSERLTLVDAAGLYVDSVRYEDSVEWSPAADGEGQSLEKIHPDAVSDFPGSWMDSGAADAAPVGADWVSVSLTSAATSSRLYVYIEAAGEFLIDDVSIAEVANPAVNLVPNGSFDSNIAGWTLSGNHATSRWSRAPGGTIFPEAALHVISTGAGGSSTNSVRIDTSSPLNTSGTQYRLSFRYKYLSGSSRVVLRLSGSTSSSGMYWALSGPAVSGVSPGRQNTVFRAEAPPFVSRVGRWPIEPSSSEPVWIYCLVEGAATQVRLLATLAGGAQTFTMRDDGLSNDGAAGDGWYGVQLPAQANGTIVTFKIEASAAAPAGTRTLPLRSDTQDLIAYYVNNNQPDSLVPVFHFIVPSGDARSWLSGLSCASGSDRLFHFAYRGDVFYNAGIRKRGQSVCGSFKPFFQVDFRQGHELIYEGMDFQGHNDLDLQSLWTDKSLTREHMSWTLLKEMGEPYCTHDYVRIHANGAFYGLYAAMERPDARWLKRNGLNDEGNLYKATASREEVNGTYEKKTNETTGDADLRQFLTAMHASSAANLVTFFRANVAEDSIIDYQASQVLINNSDYPHKNHYLYHDTTSNRWRATSWDIDLTYGKLWDGSFGGVLNDKMHNPGITPWYTTNVRGGGTGNHLLDKFFSQAGTYYRRAYLVRLWDWLQEKYTIPFYAGRTAFLHDEIFDEQADDIATWGRSSPTANDPSAPAAFEPNLDRVRAHVSSRRAYLLNYLQTTESFSGHDSLRFTELMANPPQGADAEFLELWNNSGREIDIGGWTIEGLGGDLSPPFAFPAGTRVAKDEVFLVAKSPTVFRQLYGEPARIFGPYDGRLDNAGETLRLRDDGPGHPATIDFLRYRVDGEWPWEANGFGPSMELTEVSTWRDNDFGANWQASDQDGGSPGFIEGISQPTGPLFRRGDANADRSIDIGDALFILLHVFKGSVQPTCLQALDVNDDNLVQLADATYLLVHLFRRGAAPPTPYPGCGAVDAASPLTCVSAPGCP